MKPNMDEFAAIDCGEATQRYAAAARQESLYVCSSFKLRFSKDKANPLRAVGH